MRSLMGTTKVEKTCMMVSKFKFPKFGRKIYWIVMIELSKGLVLNDISPCSYGDRICLVKSMKDYLNIMCNF